MANDSTLLGRLATSIKGNPDAWKSIAGTPGAADILKSDPSILDQVIKDPQGALDAYNKSNTAQVSGNSTSPSSNLYIKDSVTTPQVKSPESMGLLGLDKDILAKASATFDGAISGLNQDIAKLEAANDPLLKGQIPADVAEQIRINSAEGAMAHGLGIDSQRASNVQARDLGLTSLQIQQQGFANQNQISSTRQVAAQLSEAQSQFEKTYALNTQQFLDNVRRTDLTGTELDLQRQQFNAQQQMLLIGHISELVKANAQISASAASNDVDSSSLTASFDQLISQINGLLTV